MIFYHGTTLESWDKIQNEGILWGVRFDGQKEISRCTYLASDKEEASQYGEIVLQVEYNPHENCKMNNYIDECWQMRVYEPINIKNITLVK